VCSATGAGAVPPGSNPSAAGSPAG
jgi:hypothetical protein